MPSASSSSSASASSHRTRRRLTREQLLKSLDILGPLSAPLPPELPPSPPASRQSSPHALKRRRDVDPEQRRSKKARLDDGPEPARHRRPPQPQASHKPESQDDGEVKDEPQSSSLPSPVATPLPFTPANRPRRGRVNPNDWRAIFDKANNAARQLFYSSHARTCAAYPPTHSSYRPLPQSPSPGSPYAQHSLLIARLELIDGLLHFIYALWWKDQYDKTCYRGSWRTMDHILIHAKQKWQAESSDDREKAFYGLIHMADAFINGRRAKYQLQIITQEVEMKISRINLEIKAAEQRAAEAQARARAHADAASNATPKMLPSPASSSSAGSANSTPLSHGTPNHNSSNLAPKPSEPKAPLPVDVAVTPVGLRFLSHGKAQNQALGGASAAMEAAQKYLTLPVLARYFPRTLARMLHTSLSVQEEYEPDFQDEEGELFWPGQLVTGEGLGWVALMGMAMVREFGKEFGYQGIDGVVPRPPGAPSACQEPHVVTQR